MKPAITFFTCLLSFSTLSHAAEFFVAPTGADTNPGTKDAPFATLNRAQTSANPGDTVFLRGGKYAVQESHIARKDNLYAYVFDLHKSGEKSKPITYAAFENERPVFDFDAVQAQGFRIIAFNAAGSYLHFKGFEVTGVRVTITGHTQSESFHNTGSNNTFERLAMHDSQAIGFYLLAGSDVLVDNCDAYRNYDFTSEGGKGGNTDGFGAHPRKGSTNIVFRNCRAWYNSDDGYDCINAAETVTFDHCWAMYNGLSPEGKSLGDGNGFKAGGYGATPVARLPNPIPRHVVSYCLSVGNKVNGFYANHHVGGQDWIHNTAYRNANNFNMLERLDDNKTDVPGTHAVLRFNLSYNPRGGKDLADADLAKITLERNSFDTPLKMLDAHFLSVDEKELVAPRQPDGSLPKINFLHFAPTGPLANAPYGCFAAVPK